MAPRGLYARLCHAFSSFIRAELSQYLLDRFSRSFHQMEGISVNFLDLVKFFRFLKGRCHGNQFSGKNGQNYLPPALIALSIQNWMGYRDLNVRVISANDVSIPRKNVVNVGPVTPDKTGLICILFYDMAKMAYLVKYWTNFYNLFTIWNRFECRW